MYRIALIIVAHRHYPQLRQLLLDIESLSVKVTVFFVDNGTGGKSTKWLASKNVDVVYLNSRRNLHYCGGNNIALRRAIKLGYDYALLLNPDVHIINSYFLEHLIEFMVSNPTCCFCGPLVLSSSSKSTKFQNTLYRFPTFINILTSFIRFKSPIAPTLSSPPREPVNVDYLNGVCVLVCLEKIVNVGLLNVKLGGYYEDAEWAYRASSLGYSSYFVPVSSIVHEQDQAEYRDYTVKCFMLRRNLLYLLIVQKKLISFAAYFVCSFFVLFSRFFYALVLRRYSVAASYAYLIKRFSMSFLSLCVRARARSSWFGPPLGKPYTITYSK